MFTITAGQRSAWTLIIQFRVSRVCLCVWMKETAHLRLANSSCLFFEGVATLGAKIVKAVSCLESGEILLGFTTSKDCLTVNGWGWLGLSIWEMQLSLKGNKDINMRMCVHMCMCVCACVRERDWGVPDLSDDCGDWNPRCICEEVQKPLCAVWPTVGGE